MMHKNLKSLRRSISEKLLGVNKQPQLQKKSLQNDEKPIDRPGSSNSLEEDPFREFLQNNSDNVSHLVFHGSSLKSLSTYDLDRENGSTPRHSSRTSTDSQTSQTSLPSPPKCCKTATTMKTEQAVTFAA